MNGIDARLLEARRRSLGVGLRCAEIERGVDIGRDLALAKDPQSNKVDLARIEGADNLNQCLSIALTTALGDDVFDTAFGFDGFRAFAEETNALMVRERVRVSIIRVLKRDPRVRRIVDLKILDRRLDVSTRPAAAGADVAAQVDAWRTLRVNVVFETVASETNTLTFAGGPINA